MRLPFPEFIPFRTIFLFAALLAGVQLAERTDPTFALCSFLFVVLSGVAFNTGGGLTRPSGAYVFFFAMLGVIIGLVWKAVLGEPAESNLLSPYLTMYIYVVGMGMMLLSAYLSRKFMLRRPILGNILPANKVQTATVGCIVTAFAIVALELVAPGGNGSVLSALNQLNHFFPLAIMLGVIHTMKRTGGKQSVNMPVLLASTFLFITGVIGFSKEGMLGPFVAWGLAAGSQRYRMSRAQVVIGILALVFVFRYLVPYSQYGRNFKQGDLGLDTHTAVEMLSHLGEVRQLYLVSSEGDAEDRLYGYYNTSQGFFDRLQMITIDDALINHTVNFGFYGLLPVVHAVENVVPHFIWKDKPSFLIGNTYAHEIDLLAPDDESTGVSFSSMSTAYHMTGWPGVIFLAPLAWFVLFWVFDSLCGDVRQAPWGLMVMLMFSHSAPEGDITAIIYVFTTGAFGVAFASLMTAYVMPIIGSFFIGPEAVFLKRARPIRSIPRRIPSRLASLTPLAPLTPTRSPEN
ncbi:MAG: hypothetical protein M3Y50_11945 [Acidobacteriota bacterium]|nr:hypothetical protein [Acidobacteriota bacterium]